MALEDEIDPKSSVWNWPAEWAVEHAFWREVATRTLAGVLTLIILGVPVVVWAMINSRLSVDQGAPILIGVGLSLILLTLYLTGIGIARRVKRRRIAKVLAADPEVGSSNASAERLLMWTVLLSSRVPGGDLAERTLHLRARLSEESKAEINHINRVSNLVTTGLSISASAVGLIVALLILWSSK